MTAHNILKEAFDETPKQIATGTIKEREERRNAKSAAGKPITPQEVYKLNRITPKDLDHFSEAEWDEFQQLLTEKMVATKGDEGKVDSLLRKVSEILQPDSRNDTWQRNHVNITRAIRDIMKQKGRMATTSEIVEYTKLSRQTVIKHLRDYRETPLYKAREVSYQILTDQVIDSVCTHALHGDMKAAKLFLTVMGKVGEGATNNTQNNYLQINNTILSQRDIQQLPPAQREMIESILLSTLPSPVPLARG